jgi:hypothetical protein
VYTNKNHKHALMRAFAHVCVYVHTSGGQRLNVHQFMYVFVRTCNEHIHNIRHDIFPDAFQHTYKYLHISMSRPT